MRSKAVKPRRGLARCEEVGFRAIECKV